MRGVVGGGLGTELLLLFTRYNLIGIHVIAVSYLIVVWCSGIDVVVVVVDVLAVAAAAGGGALKVSRKRFFKA